MRKVLKWFGIGLGVLVGLLIIGYIAAGIAANGQLDQDFGDVTVRPIEIPDDEESLARGKHLAEAVSGCVGCHGDDFGGGVVLDDPAIGVFYAPNLTSGQGGRGPILSEEQWVRAVRYGVRHDDKSVVIMPATAYAYLTDEDLGAIIAYARSAPPVDNETPPLKFGPLGRVLLVMGAFGDLPAATVDRDRVQPASMEPEISVEYGEYISFIAGCRDCHGSDLAGGTASGGPPPGNNLTPAGPLGSYNEADFIATIRTGTLPNGQPLSDDMPWKDYRNMTDLELTALWQYLAQVPEVE